MSGHEYEDEVAELFKQEARKIYRYLRFHGASVERAEDCIQAAFEAACARWHSIRSYENRGAWVMMVAKQRFHRNAGRDEKRRRLELEREVRRGQPVAADEISDVHERMELGALIAKLPPRQRQVLWLRFGRDMTIAAVAEYLEVTEPAVKTHLARALSTLRRKLGDDASGGSDD